MKKIILFIGVLLLLMTSMTCQKKACIVTDGGQPIVPNVDTINHSLPTDRNDVPLPPSEPWWTLDTTNLDPCQNRLWGYLKRMYPNREEDYWDYEIYSIMDEPEEVFANRAFRNQFYYFFNDTFLVQTLNAPTLPCTNVDTTFFLQALGQPTLRTYHYYSGAINYFYYFKLRYRQGPCPYIFNQGSEHENKYNMGHFMYCPALLKMNFEKTKGMLTYIDFL